MPHQRSRHQRPPCKSAPGTPLCCSVFPVSPVVKPLLLLLILALLLVPASAQVRNWRVADFKDTISIAADGTALVSEKITLAFVGEWHGIHRTIPVEYPGPHGTNYTLFLNVMSVTDENGNKLKYDSSKSGAYPRSQNLYSRRGRHDARRQHRLLRSQRRPLSSIVPEIVPEIVTPSSTGT